MLDKRAQHITLNDRDVMLAGNSHQSISPLQAHQCPRRIDNRGLNENCLDTGDPAAFVERFRNNALIIDGKAFKCKAKIGG